MAAWSYSSIKTFDQCPKKYYHLKVAKDTKDEGSEATIYGNEVHAAAENYVKHGTPVPEKYGLIARAVEIANKYPGDKHAELKLGVKLDEDGNFLPCDFFDPDVWYRGIVDLLVVEGYKAKMLDWKTGKSSRYADTKQLDLMAGAVFTHFPDVMIIKSALAFLVPGDLIKKTHVRTEKRKYMGVFSDQLDRLEAAHASGVWNAVSSGLCPWCPVKSCENWRPRRS